MTQCKATTLDTQQCFRSTLKSGFSKQHVKDAKISMYRKELVRMHQRVRLFSEKTNKFHSMISDIQRLDYLKHNLSKLEPVSRAYRHIIQSPNHRFALEKLFDLPYDEILPYYESLLKRRNEIVHRYSMVEWNGGECPETIKYKSRFK